MANIGAQIIAARKAKGMTQEELSSALNISRSLISHYEHDRRVPDPDTLLRLSKVLECSFGKDDADAEQAGDLAMGETAEPPQEKQSPTREAEAKPAKGRWLALCAVAAILLCAVVAALALRGRGTEPTVYLTEDGQRYTIDQFRQKTPREAGKAYLSTEKIVKVQQGEGIDMWMYEIVFHEMNGVALAIDRIEVYTFVGETVHPQLISRDALESYGLETDISPRGDWSLFGGMPVQNTVSGVGVVLIGTDGSGESLTFTDFLKLNAVE